jgi:hypothetical protein
MENNPKKRKMVHGDIAPAAHLQNMLQVKDHKLCADLNIMEASN